MAIKGFAKAEEIERISKEEMKKLSEADSTAKLEGAKKKRAVKAYEDEFTEEPEDETEVPEELEEPEVPEKKAVPKSKPKETKERSSDEIAKAIYEQGFQAGHKYRTKELIEFLVS